MENSMILPAPADVVALLAPALPYLLSASRTAGEEAAKDLGKGTWSLAKRIWTSIGHRVSTDGDGTKQELRILKEVETLLTDDPALMTQVVKILGQRSVDASRKVAIGGNVTGSTIVVGDRNTVGSKRGQRR